MRNDLSSKFFASSHLIGIFWILIKQLIQGDQFFSSCIYLDDKGDTFDCCFVFVKGRQVDKSKKKGLDNRHEISGFVFI